MEAKIPNIESLKWHLQMGVDEAIENEPVNRFKAKPATAVITESAGTNTINIQTEATMPKASKVTISSPSLSLQNTRKIADECKDLESLRAAVNSFNELSIAKTATNTVFADGNPDAEVMLIGEAPGAEEDAQGIPFCGASGQLLDQMLAHIGLTRQKNFYITNTIFWRPPGNRRPTPEELAICLPFVEKHIALVRPKIIILVGGTAIASLIDSKLGITKIRGSFFGYNNQYLEEEVQTTAIFHPSYLLRSPGQKRIAWKDLLTIKQFINKNKIKI